jgi:hypothetical protein
MKKLFPLLVFFSVFLASCEKDYCWNCELTTGRRTPPFPWIYTTTQQEYCDKTEEEIAQMINDHEYTKGMSSYSHMTCTKKQ